MIFILIALLALAVLAPLLLVLRGRAATRGARELALELHRTQLRELDRDLAEGRILPPEHATALLEVQRRMLAAAASAEGPPRAGARWPIIGAAIAVPLVAFALYAVSGSEPFMPSVSGAEQQARSRRETALIDDLRQRLAQLPADDDRTRQGYVLLGSAEEVRGNVAAAAEAFRLALRGKFDPDLAARAAEDAVRAEGGVSEQSAALFRRALATNPAAPWHALAEQRLSEPRLP